jgi:hypothetical protein
MNQSDGLLNIFHEEVENELLTESLDDVQALGV